MARSGVALGLLGAVAIAQAALWGYVDADGVAHFAERQIDSRYSLVIGDSAASRARDRESARQNHVAVGHAHLAGDRTRGQARAAVGA